ncbi:unnamed protein product [Brassica napus]|uniref:(rape) hypothetical protein n=1 Tax=Brassica napus TaxID=3708 RepID=A0A816TG60_BRANA|nr:unnamed protein product [Brassica napus]
MEPKTKKRIFPLMQIQILWIFKRILSRVFGSSRCKSSRSSRPAYFTEALANRILKSWPGLYKALNATQTRTNNVSEEVHVRRLFFDMFPILKLSFLLTILEAMEGEKMVHVVDLDASEPDLWLALIQAYNSRPEGPPHLRITGVHHHKEVLDQMAHRLIEEAEKLYIPFQFRRKIDRFLNAIWGLSPKIMVVTEQDSDHNGSTLMERLLESLYTYAALFDCLENKIPRTSQDRIKVEKMQFGEEIKNIIACEGSERRE